jgi:glycosyltransferase involved in cell wall biosynthesis
MNALSLSQELSKSRIAWLIPCHNEELTIAQVIKDIFQFAPGSEIYVCDNNSTDATAVVAARHGASVIRESKRGKGHALRALIEHVDADIYMMVDGDNTYSIAHWKKLAIPVADGASDMVVANRLENFSGQSFPPLHELGNRILSGLFRIFFGVRQRDVLSGYRAMSRRFVKGLEIKAKGFDIDTELTILALKNRLIVNEIALPYGTRPLGSNSKLKTFRDGFVILFIILSHFRSFKMFVEKKPDAGPVEPRKAV